MPRYFFDLVSEDDTDADEAGLDFPSILEAKAEAIQALAEIARPDLRLQALQVRDENGAVVATVTLTIED